MVRSAERVSNHEVTIRASILRDAARKRAAPQDEE